MKRKEFEEHFGESKNGWEFKAYLEIKHKIPKGHVITYGGLANCTF